MYDWELQVIERRAANAPPGPWYAKGPDLLGWYDVCSAAGNPVCAVRHPYLTQQVLDFLWHAQVDMLTLVDEVRRLSAPHPAALASGPAPAPDTQS